MEGIAQDERIVQRIMEDVVQLMEPFAQWERIKAIRVLGQLFTIENGELTPTMKLKRKPIKERYNHLIENLYG